MDGWIAPPVRYGVAMDAGGAGGGGDGGARREDGDDFLLSGRQDAAVLGVRGDGHFQRYLSDSFYNEMERNPGAIPNVAVDSKLLSCQIISGNTVTGMGRRTQVRHPAEVHRRRPVPLPVRCGAGGAGIGRVRFYNCGRTNPRGSALPMFI